MRQLIFFAWEHMLLANVRRAGGPDIARSELAQARRRLPHYAMPGTDAKARGNRRFAEGILALATLLEEEYGQARAGAFDLTKTAVCATGRNLSVLTMKLWLAVTPDPLSTLHRRPPSNWVIGMCGNGISAVDTFTEDTAALQVVSCPFTDFFWNAGRADLTSILEAWDHTWMAVLNRSSRPIRVTRGAALSGTFTLHFRRTETVHPRRCGLRAPKSFEA